jgi:Zn-dependent protease
MRWSWQVAKVAGIPIRIHATFFLFLVFLYVVLARDQSSKEAAEWIGFLLALFGCVVATRAGTRDHRATLWGEDPRHHAPPDRRRRAARANPEKPAQEIAVALAGPAVNVVIALALLATLVATGVWETLRSPAELQQNFAGRLLAYNVFLALFNLIPAFPMDGGRVLRALLAIRLDYVRATPDRRGRGAGNRRSSFGLLGLWGNPILLFIALFVFIGAGQEAQAVMMRSAFDGVPVGRAMIRDFRALRPTDPLARAVELLLDGHQQDFPCSPVPARCRGSSRARISSARLANGDTARPVSEFTRTTCGTAHPRDLLDRVFQRMQETGCPAVPVVGRGRDARRDGDAGERGRARDGTGGAHEVAGLARPRVDASPRARTPSQPDAG